MKCKKQLGSPDFARRSAVVSWAIFMLMASTNAAAQNLSSTFKSSGFIMWFMIIPFVLACLLCIGLWQNPLSRHLIWKSILAWVGSLLFAFLLINSGDTGGFGLLAYIYMVFSPWIGVMVLFALFIDSRLKKKNGSGKDPVRQAVKRK